MIENTQLIKYKIICENKINARLICLWGNLFF